MWRRAPTRRRPWPTPWLRLLTTPIMREATQRHKPCSRCERVGWVLRRRGVPFRSRGQVMHVLRRVALSVSLIALSLIAAGGGGNSGGSPTRAAAGSGGGTTAAPRETGTARFDVDVASG